MLRRIRITGYKSLRAVEVGLRPLTVLVGSNAAGKSNFLDALQLLSRIASVRTLKEAFEPPYRGRPLESFHFGQDGLEGLRRQEAVRFTFEADIELSQAVVDAVTAEIAEMRKPAGSGNGTPTAEPVTGVHRRLLRYRVTIEMKPASGILRIADEYLAALNQDGTPTKARQPYLEVHDNRLRLRMEGQGRPTQHELFLDHSILSKPLYPPHHPHLVAVRREFESWLLFYFEPRERMRLGGPAKEVAHLGLYGEDLAAFLNTVKAKHPKALMAIERSLAALVPGVTGIDVSVDRLGEVELGVMEGDRHVPARLVSEGTLRMIGLLGLAGMQTRPGLVAFEEPENGISPRRIQGVAELLRGKARAGGTQFIVTTHSPLLADEMPPDSIYICRRTAEGTAIVPLDAPLWGRPGIAAALDGMDELPVSERIRRGDFDG